MIFVLSCLYSGLSLASHLIITASWSLKTKTYCNQRKYLNQGRILYSQAKLGAPEGEQNIKNSRWILLQNKKIHVQALT